ncbi:MULTISPECIES: UDP-N-acetylmuramoyl-L-alanyl-D-glutamate--2,6-diaminopimelate ligase [Prauserella salsuginis group]|uniref:UDP-N-acetylmuramoyl-L-alanyl-D-glutamate--2,6-diaminopimelate ligase n=1 Tax=Prauserella salsuginis TaxID=387889 RepID=A0ABW6G8B9_9PSEU|nr:MULTISPECIES: UDP-N-acetylmuramoyl-L-alanyl-D-glutamate--2,6-diaminopimelate ligase [Prauserella salsuginis group]
MSGPSAAPSGRTGPPRPAYTEPVPVTTLVARSGSRLLADPSAPEVTVTGATLRGQDVRPGDLFAALPGARVHGADFAAGAIAAGAAAILTDEAGTERPAIAETELPVLVHSEPRAVLGEIAAWIYGEPSLTLNVLGTTGTSGKTTTAYLVESGLRAAGHTTGLIGTVETRVSGERLASAFTTPEAPDLQALFALMVEQGVTHVPMEVSSHALSLGRVNGTRFTVGAFTNLSQDHLDFHRDMDDYFAAKSLLFDGRSTSEVVVVDAEWGRRLVTPQTITVATERGVDAVWRATDIATTPTGEQGFTLHGPDGRTARASIPLPGEFNVANATLAAAILDTVGIPLDAIVAGLASVEVPGRMERVALGQPFAAVVDYAHKPAAVTEALRALRAGTQGRIITVLGCGGDRDTAKRAIMGEAAVRGSELVIVTDDNPRSEDPAAIRAEILQGARAVDSAEAGEIREIGDRREAIVAAVAAAGHGDVVLVAGKGHESGQNIAGVVHPFSDRDELAAAIRDRFEVSV